MIYLSSEDAMLAFAAKLATFCQGKEIIFLSGPLGAGKTTFVRGFLRGLGFKGHVKSPTYTIVESYEVNAGTVYHFDLYRIKDAEELLYIGITDYFSNEAICLIEWAELGADLLPESDLTCYIAIKDDERILQLDANTKKGEQLLKRLLADSSNG